MARILVTGASTGLGLLTARSLVDLGHEIVLHARTPERVEDRPLLDVVHGAVYGDLAELETMRRLAEEVNSLGPFDAVIYNAGVGDRPEVLAVNTVAPYALTALMDRPARSIVLSSSLHRSGSSRHVGAAIAGRRGVNYNDTKLWVTALFLGIARRWPQTLAHVVDPGWVPTRMGGHHASGDLTEGHRTQEWLATAPEHEIDPRTGGYWYHRAARHPHPAALDESFQEEVISALAASTGIELPD